MTKGANNPCQFQGPITEPDQFFGRKDQLRRILQDLRQGQSVWVVGGPKAGKTSLLYRIQQILDQASQVEGLEWTRDLLGLYIDVRQDTIRSQRGLLLSAFRQISDRGYSLEFDVEAGFDVYYIKDRLQALRPMPILLLDNFESAIDSFTLDDFYGLRTLDSSHMLFVVAAIPVRIPMEHQASPFFLSLRKEFLGSFSPEAFDHFIEEMSHRSGVGLEDYEEKILDLAGRLPYFVQLACWHYMQAGVGERPISAQDRAMIRQEFAAAVQDDFTAIWQALHADQRTVLLEIAGELGTGEEAMLAVEELEQEGYLIDGKAFSSVFKDFVLQQV